MKFYRIYMRSFAPWPAFGGVLPGAAYSQSGRVTTVNNTNYDGDNRGFSLDTDNNRVTARINFWIDVFPTSWQTRFGRIWCNESRGPWLLVGPIGGHTAYPVANISSYPRRDGLHLDVSYSAANPLVPGSPDINARGVFDFRLGSGPEGSTLSIDTEISGDQFPAFESFIDDQSGNKVFLGGFAPESRSPGQLIRLFGQLNRPGEIYFRSSVVISLGPEETFLRVRGTFGTQLSSQTLLNFNEASSSLQQWNTFIMRSVPMPIDGWLY